MDDKAAWLSEYARINLSRKRITLVQNTSLKRFYTTTSFFCPMDDLTCDVTDFQHKPTNWKPRMACKLKITSQFPEYPIIYHLALKIPGNWVLSSFLATLFHTFYCNNHLSNMSQFNSSGYIVSTLVWLCSQI